MTQMLPIARVLGLMAMVMSSTHLLPIAASVIFEDGTLLPFLFSMVFNFTCGLLVWIATRHHRQDLRPRDGFMLVTLAWTGGAAFSTVPFLEAIPGLSFTDAYFESISALTTTGATVLVNLDTMPQAINLWRHLLQWLGGMGIIVLAVAVLPLLGIGGRQIFKAETPGPMKDTQLTPRITETAKNLWLVYVGITFLCALALRIAGMGWFDAVCHAFSTLSTGGFSTHDASIGYFNSVAIEAVMIYFMMVAAVNFATHFLVFRGKSFLPYLRDVEARPVWAVLIASSLGIAAYLYDAGTYESFWTALRHASFNLVSVATSTGYASVDYANWPVFAPIWMLFLSCLACSSGSTGGGIKMVRTLILIQQAFREMRLLLHPSAVSVLKVGGAVIPNKIIFAVLAFIFVYFISLAAFTLILLASGLDLVTSISATLASINNVGPGLGQVGPAGNYALLTDFQKWLLAFAMLVGRLELLTVFVLFTPGFWQK
ncbi:MAG: TrkH family potassium uptake protein [Betaproteobacteria bacterium]|nr:TrkH family potassium uptake protein [Betaproteobacteria bacterium]